MSRVEPSPAADATLRAIGAAVTLRIDDVDPAGLAELNSYGWVCTFKGRVALTGAGACHAGLGRGGMLGV